MPIFDHGAAPTPLCGSVTAISSDGKGRILEIDGKPAGETYSRWTGGSFDEELAAVVARAVGYDMGSI